MNYLSDLKRGKYQEPLNKVLQILASVKITREPLINPKCFLGFRYSCYRGIFLSNTACLAKENNDEDKDT